MRIAFTRLQTRLTVLYAALFGAVLVVLAIALQIGISANARRETGAQLQASGAVFERVWALHAERLQQGAEVLAQDFGFRQAVATGDPATARSALENLQHRLDVDSAMILKADGTVMAADAPAGVDTARLIAALDPQEASSGVLTLGGKPYLAVAAPILAPDPQGWVVFAAKLGRPELEALERMSSIPIRADIHADAGAQAGAKAASARLDALVSRALKGEATAPTELNIGDAPALVLVRRLTALDGGPGAGLVLSYPLAAAMAPYDQLRALMVGIGLCGAALMALGGWIVARGVTRPVRALDEAAQALGEGRHAELAVEGEDELARLAGSFNRMAGVIRDREAHILGLAHRDVETGMGNRRALERDVAGQLAGARDGRIAVAVFGVDRFAKVRGAIGHANAQALIAAAGRRLSELSGAPVVRLSTSTLAIAFPCADASDAGARLEAMTRDMRTGVGLTGVTVDVTTTCGFGLASPGDPRPETVIEQAAIALDQAVAGLRRVAAYDPDAYGDPARNLSLMSELMEALDSGAFSLAYQPKYDLRRGAVTGVEALARWRHPARGPISPDLFITMAEETGHIREITDWVLDRAVADQAKLAAAGLALEMSVNLSGRLLADDAFIGRALERMAPRAGALCLEITETAVIDNPDRALRNIERLREANLALSIDDYGSGLSSLAYLRDLKADELKIDKAFVMRMDVTAKDALLVRSTIDMAHSLGLKVTAEGVETAATQALLAGMGCDLAQGYFIAKPMPLPDLERFLDADGAHAALRTTAGAA